MGIIQPHALSGQGGIGKTRLAIEYAFQHRQEFTAVLFVSANTGADLETNLARVCSDVDSLDLAEYRLAPQPELLRLAVSVHLLRILAGLLKPSA